MGARELLTDLNAAGFEVRAEGCALLVRPMASLPQALRQELIDNKPELLAIAPRRSWRVSLPGRPAFIALCPQGATAEEILARWPGAKVEAAG